MATQDKCCTIVPYFKVQSGKLEAFKALSEQFVEKTRAEPKCHYYGFSFAGDVAFCREGYEDAEGVLAISTTSARCCKKLCRSPKLRVWKFTVPKKNWQSCGDPWPI
jgi:hypothetical protein